MSTNDQYPLSFTGTGGEFFRIWIVNIALTLVTFGIYSAWAKVRTKRWFYGHTFLDQQTFGYHATPIQILKGRLIAIAFLIVYFITIEFAPMISVAFMIVIYLATPWIINQSLKFNARNSSYRSIRFAFTGTLSNSIKNFMLLPMLIFVTFGLALPYVTYKQTKYIVDHYQYGQTTNQLNVGSGEFWKVYGMVFLYSLIPLLLFLIVLGDVFKNYANGTDIVTDMLGFSVSLAIIIFYLAAIFIGAYIKVNIANMIFNNSNLGEISFVSTQRVRDVTWIYISNIILIALTLGIFIPWAKVRLVRYRAEHLLVSSSKDLAEFGAGQKEQVSSAGDELADVLDLDFAL